MLQTQDSSLTEVKNEFHNKYASVIHINPNIIGSSIYDVIFKIMERKMLARRRTNY
ncbi:hypothetical protein [Bartonella rattaustraliani]|uniref:hypothetical protein n=1 Tax=Bartonella rattaustraliani TaxID=481139 RepID=UPI0002D6B187